MQKGHFYFIKDEYFDKFNDKFMMSNKKSTDRPCYCAIKSKNTEIYWLVPLSSKLDKYKKLHKKYSNKYKNYTGIVFGKVKGNESAFLIQNMCPITEKYIANEYFYKDTNRAVKVSDKITREVEKAVFKALSMTRKGKKSTFTDILKIEKILLSE